MAKKEKSELDRQIAKAMATVRRRKVFDRIVEIIRHYRAEHLENDMGHTCITGSRMLYIGGTLTQFTERSTGEFHQLLEVEAHFGGSIVFAATRFPRGTLPNQLDPRRVYHTANHSYAVGHFKTGIWTKLLNINMLIRRDAAAVRRRQREDERQAKLKLKEKSKPYHEDDSGMARRFGLRAS